MPGNLERVERGARPRPAARYRVESAGAVVAGRTRLFTVSMSAAQACARLSVGETVLSNSAAPRSASCSRRPRCAGGVSPWWRDLQSNPKFKALMSGAR
jgi:hypothetical protein